jgi:hypothetical protein
VVKPEFSLLEYNRKKIAFYRDALDEVERMNENLGEDTLVFVDLLQKELRRRREE